MVAHVFPEMPGAASATVHVRAMHPLPAAAFATLRELSARVREIPLSHLLEQLGSAQGISLGLQPEYRARELQIILEGLGLEVSYVPQDNVA